jgi:hypothetical protein
MSTLKRLRIGVSGHRVPPKLPEESETPLRALIDRIFAAIAADAPGTGKDQPDRVNDFIIVSSLAEGSDRIVAEAGLAAGFKLDVVLPFGRTEYARDFDTQASREEFTQLLARAAAIVELDGAANDRPRAYEAAGLYMLANTDLMIAIWDGRSAAGVGGTAQIVDRAVNDGILVVWIEPTHLNAIQVSWHGTDDARPANAEPQSKNVFHPADVAAIARAVKKILTPSTR